jgi:uncharacterized protein with FMN-binding domain
LASKKPGFVVRAIILTVVLLVLATVAGLATYGQYYGSKYASVRNMTIEDQPLQLAMNGPHLGAYSYGGFVYEVEVTVMYHEITDIKIISNRATRHARQAEAVIERVMAKGNVNVEAVSGATVTSKALLKAMEQAIAGGC